jgi:hypothetical protein
MKSPILCLLWFMTILTARAESPSEAEIREFLRPALHPAMSADEHKKLLEAAAGNAGDVLLASAYGTNTLSATLLAADPDVRVLHAMDFKPGTFAATNLLQLLIVRGGDGPAISCNRQTGTSSPSASARRFWLSSKVRNCAAFNFSAPATCRMSKAR